MSGESETLEEGVPTTAIMKMSSCIGRCPIREEQKILKNIVLPLASLASGRSSS